MPIKSYLLISKKDQIANLQAELAAFQNCEISKAENKEVLILLTDTPDEATDKKLFNQLLQLSALEHINLVSAFS